MDGKLDIQVAQESGAAIVSITGDVDLYSSPEARKVILDQTTRGSKAIIMDLSGVEYMDSSGVATLVEGLQRMEQQRGAFILCGLNAMVREVFELTRLNTVFQIVGTLPEAKVQVQQAQIE